MNQSDIPKDRIGSSDASSGKHPSCFLNHSEVEWLDFSLQCDLRLILMIGSVCPLWALHWDLICGHFNVPNYGTHMEDYHLDKVCRCSQTRPEEGVWGDGHAPPQGRRVGASEVKDGGVGVYGGTMDNRDAGGLLMRDRSPLLLNVANFLRLSTLAYLSGGSLRAYVLQMIMSGMEIELSEENSARRSPALIAATAAMLPIIWKGKRKKEAYPGKIWCDRIICLSPCISGPNNHLKSAPSLMPEVEEDITFLPECLRLRAKLHRVILGGRWAISLDRYSDVVCQGQFPFVELMVHFPIRISPHSPLPLTVFVFMVTIVPTAVATDSPCEIAQENASLFASQEQCLGKRMSGNQSLLGVVS